MQKFVASCLGLFFAASGCAHGQEIPAIATEPPPQLTARDWVRFGQFLLQEGVWNGREILPPGFVQWMREPAPASDGVYGNGQLWLKPGGPNDLAGLPPDTFWLIGHDGQSMAVAPSKQLVVLRLGLTPSRQGYRPQRLLAAIVSAIE